MLPVEIRIKIWTWYVELLRYGGPRQLPAVFADSCYLDHSSRVFLQQEEVLYHCSAKMCWYKDIKCHVEAKLHEMGRWAAMHNTETGEFACVSWSEKKNIGKKLLLSTLLQKKLGAQHQDSPPGWVHYLDLFNVCNEFNKRIRNVWWPYRIPHHMQRFNEMYHVHVLLNPLAVWRELHHDKEQGTDKQLLLILAREVLQRAHESDLPASRW